MYSKSYAETKKGDIYILGKCATDLNDTQKSLLRKTRLAILIRKTLY